MTKTWNFVVTVGLCAGVAGGQTTPTVPSVSLDPQIECWSLDGHPSVQATVTPDAPIARLYFRCSLYPDYYFVDLEPQEGNYAAILPQAEATCPAVHYYVEAVGSDFASSRTRERVARREGSVRMSVALSPCEYLRRAAIHHPRRYIRPRSADGAWVLSLAFLDSSPRPALPREPPAVRRSALEPSLPSAARLPAAPSWP